MIVEYHPAIEAELKAIESNMDNRKRARVIIVEVLNLALNRHLHMLGDQGYLNTRNYGKDHGFEDGQAALRLKQDLVEEMCKRFEPALTDYLEYPREQLWPVHDENAVKEQLCRNFPEGKL
jgi:hypothetical protein